MFTLKCMSHSMFFCSYVAQHYPRLNTGQHIEKLYVASLLCVILEREHFTSNQTKIHCYANYGDLKTEEKKWMPKLIDCNV